ncbi:MAG TPA: ATP-binding protein [Burkholderiales bacterium]|nr:ATP-binding protein [Burkholderiales bacterium]
MARPSLRRRLLGVILGLTALAWLAIGVSAYLEVRHEARELFEEHLSRSEARHAREEIVEALGESLVWPLAAALPALALAIWLGVGSGLRPLRELRDQLAQRSPTDLAPVESARTPAEIEPLVAELNRLLGRIGETLQRERRLTADAAHELRTPLAVLSTQAQVARRATSDTARDEALDALAAGAERAARLIEQMLTLARLESGQPQGAMQRVELRALAREVAAELAPRALHKHIELALEEGPPTEVSGHPGLLTVLLRNLVDNAVRYTPAGGSVWVGVRAPATLEVRDSGPGVPAAELPRLGERFHRLAPQGEAGSGLGLSIVLRIAELHGAHVRFGNATEGGLAATVSFTACR